MSDGLTDKEQQVLIFVLRKDIARLEQAIIDNCPHSMVQCGCGLHYKLPSSPVCTVCTIRTLEAELATKDGFEDAKVCREIARDMITRNAERAAWIFWDGNMHLISDEAKLKDDLATSQTEANDLRVRVEGLLREREELING